MCSYFNSRVHIYEKPNINVQPKPRYFSAEFAYFELLSMYAYTTETETCIYVEKCNTFDGLRFRSLISVLG